jgi:hypothetical protein
MTWMKASCVMSLQRCRPSHRFELRLWGYGTTSMATPRPGGFHPRVLGTTGNIARETISTAGRGDRASPASHEQRVIAFCWARPALKTRLEGKLCLDGPPIVLGTTQKGPPTGAPPGARRSHHVQGTTHSASVPSRQDGTGQPVETTRKKDSLSTAKSEQASPTSSTGALAHPSRYCRGGGRRQRIGTICAMDRAHSALRLAETRPPRAGRIWLLLGASRPRGALSSLWTPARLMLPRLLRVQSREDRGSHSSILRSALAWPLKNSSGGLEAWVGWEPQSAPCLCGPRHLAERSAWLGKNCGFPGRWLQGINT